jgi:cholest-4-en-3-one 26-monooxygenase
MARLEMRTAFEELLRRFPTPRLLEAPDRLQSNFINGIKSMPVALR